MRRVAAPDGACREVDGLSGLRYRATGGGMFEMTDRDAKKLVELGGFVPDQGGVIAAYANGKPVGFRCTCGFGSYFRTCSRCGGECEKAR